MQSTVHEVCVEVEIEQVAGEQHGVLLLVAAEHVEELLRAPDINITRAVTIRVEQYCT